MYDLILRGGTVVDGKRSQPYAADICIREGRIARIAPEGGEEAGRWWTCPDWRWPPASSTSTLTLTLPPGGL